MLKPKILLIIVVLGIVGSQTAVAEKVLKASSEGWTYSDKKESPGKEWNKLEFDDSKWAKGQAPLGYGDSDIKTKIKFGDDDENKNLVSFFRKSIEVKDTDAIQGLHGQLVCDDGAVVYANGKEIYRINIPKGKVKDTTLARIPKGGELERLKHHFVIDAADLKKGKNVIAIRVHQVNPGSSDLALDVELDSIADEAKYKQTKETAEKERKSLEDQIDQYLQQNAF